MSHGQKVPGTSPALRSTRYFFNRPLLLITQASLSIALVLLLIGPAWAGTIDTEFLEQRPWPNEWVHETEVGRYPVVWRQRASKADGIFGSVRFEVPLPQARVWELSTDYQDVGTLTPGVTAVHYLEESETRQVIQVDVKVLWKELQLIFEVEQEPPTAIRFRLVNDLIGEYRAICRLVPVPGPPTKEFGVGTTIVEMTTWLKPARPIPTAMLLLVERMTLLRGARAFLELCEQEAN